MTIRIAAETPWYDLFSRGARDWLRHNQKVREAVKGGLPELLAGADLMTGPTSRTVMVPVKSSAACSWSCAVATPDIQTLADAALVISAMRTARASLGLLTI